METRIEVNKAMSEAVPYYWRSLDFDKLLQDYPPAPAFYDRVYRTPREQLRRLQNERFRAQMARAWEIPFFSRRWHAAGLEPDDVRGLEDLTKIPAYSVYDIRDSIEQYPPFGDFMGISPSDGKRMPLVLQSSGGTTGFPRAMLFSPQDREVSAILRSRSLHMHGVRPGDVLQVTLALGLSNAGLSIREATWKYTGAVGVMTGSGASTNSRRQIEIARGWRTTAIAGFPAYLRHLAFVARDELNIDPRSLGVRLLTSHLGMEDRKVIEELWGASCYDSYGTTEAGLMASECAHQTGMHIFEDALIIEIVDPATGEVLPPGKKGNVYVTTLYKYGAPAIRYNINDVSALVPGACPCSSTLLRLEKIFGRSDDMIKVKGTNIFPDAMGPLLAGDARTTGEFFWILENVGADGREQLTVLVEASGESAKAVDLAADIEARIMSTLGVRANVQLVGNGELNKYTGVTGNAKVKRVWDKRKDSRLS